MGKISDSIRDYISDVKNGENQFFGKLSSAKIIALGFAVIVLIGSLLLMMPAASKGEPPCFADALFTSVSATCVTGLVVFDTYTQWSLLGQIIILCLIQIGGLGFMTLISLFSMALGRKIGLKERSVLQDSVNSSQLGGIIRLVKRIVAGTFIIEGIGAVLFAVRFIPDLGVGQGIFTAVFTSISAFCNGGFDLNGRYGQYTSLVPFYSDPIVIITASMLILIGGTGFAVWNDIADNKLNISAYRLHSKIVLTMTAGLTVIGTILFWIFEQDFTISGMDFGDKLLSSFFSSVTPRTAGFNSVDTAALSPASKTLTIIYMFIGGSPGSTAGGAKTVTVAVMFLTAAANMKNSEDVNIFGRRLEGDAPQRAFTVIVINLLLTIAAVIAISAFQPELNLTDVTFECFSAVNTVGMTTGITRSLNGASKIVIMLLMYCGRVGSLTFALIFTRNRKYAGIHNPSEPVSVG